MRRAVVYFIYLVIFVVLLLLPSALRYVRYVCFLTDGFVGDDDRILATIRTKGGDARWFAFGIGSSVNRHLVEGIGRQGRGASTVVLTRGADTAERAADDFLRTLDAPSLVDVSLDDPLELFSYLNDVGGKNGVGRIDIVENRYVGIKSRGVYETPGGTILWKAHEDLEAIAMDREVHRLKESLMPRFAEIIYYGYWFSPEMDFLTAAFDKSQEAITGIVYLDIYKGNVTVTGRESVRPSSCSSRTWAQWPL